ncbi:MAG: protein translocase subunit SecD [Deltaproteobacteria bacterium]|nr:protein translocase subunit SecD [Deltaproteobacteria bacterium]
MRWRFISLFIAPIVLSIYVLTPTFGGFKDKSEMASDQGQQPPWYYKFFPDQQINLGLDLKGGIYLELEVRLEEALANRIDLISSDILRNIDNKDSIVKAERQDNPLRLVIEVKPGQEAELKDFIRKNYREALVLESGKGDNNLTYHFSDAYRTNLHDQTLRQAVETVRNRIDRYGVAEPSIQRLGGNKIAIELPGIKDPDRAIDIIKQAGQLEFKMVDDSIPEMDLKKWVAEARSALALPEGFSIQTVEKINESLKSKIPAGSEIAFELQMDPVTRKTTGGIPYLLKKKAEVTGDMLRNAQVNIQNNEPYVSLSFNNLGTKLFADLTRNNIKKRLAILLDGNVTKAPVIQSEIPNGEAQITLGWGNYNSLMKEAEDLTLVLREGALPARLEELTKTVVGPSLGSDSIQNGIRALLVAGLVVICFMGLYYRLSGVFANISLFLNILLILASLTLFGGVLTLPGIAGIVLTIGMAVDANVIVFERILEELRAGKSARAGVTAGYENAMSAIVDSNLTTLLSGLVLYQFGTGPIRGFAVTLMIGIITTMFTAILVTRVFQDWAVSRPDAKVSI